MPCIENNGSVRGRPIPFARVLSDLFCTKAESEVIVARGKVVRFDSGDCGRCDRNTRFVAVHADLRVWVMAEFRLWDCLSAIDNMLVSAK